MQKKLPRKQVHALSKQKLTVKVSFKKIGVLTILGLCVGPDIMKNRLNMFPEN